LKPENSQIQMMMTAANFPFRQECVYASINKLHLSWH